MLTSSMYASESFNEAEALSSQRPIPTAYLVVVSVVNSKETSCHSLFVAVTFLSLKYLASELPPFFTSKVT